MGRARRRRGRPIDGILVLNKSAGMTSNAALQTAKRLYFAAKAGHTGSLDPLATGVLPICFGEATKFSQFLLEADKAYRTEIILGISTDSGDADGQVIDQQSAAAVDQAAIDAVLPRFRGDIEQVPSMFSAIKKDGQPLYKLARAGIEVEREARPVTIFRLEQLAFEAGEQARLTLQVHCSKGTYIRSLAEDIGQALGCGAHVAVLHRIEAGPFVEAQSTDLATLETLKQNEQHTEMDALLLPIDSALAHLPALVVTEDSGYYLQQGQPVLVPNMPTSGMVRISTEQGQFIGVGEILDDGRVAPRRLVATTG